MPIKIKAKNKFIKPGFMMMEAVLSIFILSTVLISFVQIISKTYAAKNDKVNIVIATSLAQEGIEIVRNARDVRWKAGFGSAFVAGWTDTYKNINYTSNPVPLGGGQACSSTGHACALYIDNATGFYTTVAAGGTLTSFSRKILVTGTDPVASDAITVISTVYWDNGTRNIEINETLNNWGNNVVD